MKYNYSKLKLAVFACTARESRLQHHDMPDVEGRKPKNAEIKFIYLKGTWWAWQGLNLRPLRCQHSALPLSYTPTRVRRHLSLIDSQRAFWGPGPIATLRATCKHPSPQPS